MRRAIIVAMGILLITSGCAGQIPQQRRLRPQLYTAYNIWKHAGTLYCINFKLGSEFIPAGTAVQNVSIQKDGDVRYIHFQIASTGQVINIKFNGRWHPGQTIRSYKKGMFTRKKFSKLTRGLSKKEIHGIKSGTIIAGMSKRAVLIAYGPPPEHYTKVLTSNAWYYWMNRVRKKKICFGADERATTCSETKSDRL